MSGGDHLLLLLLVLNLSGLLGGTTSSSMQRGPSRPGPSGLCEAAGPGCRGATAAVPPPGRRSFDGAALAGDTSARRNGHPPMTGPPPAPVTAGHGRLGFSPLRLPSVTAGENVQGRAGAPSRTQRAFATSSAERWARCPNGDPGAAELLPGAGLGPPRPRSSPASSHHPVPGSPREPRPLPLIGRQ